MFVKGQKKNAHPGRNMFRDKMDKLRTFSIRSILFGVSCIAFLLAVFLYFDRRRREEFEHTKGVLHDNTVWSDTIRSFSNTDKVWESITGSKPHLYAVTIDGEDGYVNMQLEAVQNLSGSEVVLRLKNLLDCDVYTLSSHRWQNISEVYFDKCCSKMVKLVIEGCPEVKKVSFYDCYDVDDHVLADLATLKRLTTIDLDGSNATGAFLDALNQPIRSVCLRYSPLNIQQCLTTLAKMQGLEELHIEGRGETVSLKQFFRNQNLRRLSVLDLEVPPDEIEQLNRLSPERFGIGHPW